MRGYNLRMDFFISVVIPSYNRATVLPRALDSVLGQTVLPLEIIVVDDGSTDITQALLVDNYPQVSLISKSNKGVSAARNAGIAVSKGNWIAFLDSDDAWLPSKLEQQIQAITAMPDCLICHTDEIWIRNGKRVNPKHKHAKPNGWVYQDSLPLCCVSPSSILIHRSLFDQVGLFDESLPACEDYDLWLRLFSKYPVLLVNEALLVKHGGHADQLSRKHWGMDRFRVQALCKILDTGELGEDDRQATMHQLLQKIEILLAGSIKRSKHEQISHYQQIRDTYQVRYGI